MIVWGQLSHSWSKSRIIYFCPWVKQTRLANYQKQLDRPVILHLITTFLTAQFLFLFYLYLAIQWNLANSQMDTERCWFRPTFSQSIKLASILNLAWWKIITGYLELFKVFSVQYGRMILRKMVIRWMRNDENQRKCVLSEFWKGNEKGSLNYDIKLRFIMKFFVV